MCGTGTRHVPHLHQAGQHSRIQLEPLHLQAGHRGGLKKGFGSEAARTARTARSAQCAMPGPLQHSPAAAAHLQGVGQGQSLARLPRRQRRRQHERCGGRVWGQPAGKHHVVQGHHLQVGEDA